MKPKKYNAVVFIGRFQPTHTAHVEIIRRAAALGEKVIIILGSANEPRTYQNPFTVSERITMLKDAVVDSISERQDVVIAPVENSLYNNQAWAAKVQETVAANTNKGDAVAIIGHHKDDSSFYLKLFPQWAFEEVELIEPLHATDIRDLYFRKQANLRYLSAVLPAGVNQFLHKFANTPEYTQIINEREFVSAYKKQFDGLAYPPTFVTVDAAVICSGHILMIKRKAEPGRGLWALPGGFLNANTDPSLQDAMIRELREETGIKVPAPVLVGNTKGTRVFDAINRSARGRTITHCFAIQLPDGELPRVKGQDDAEKAKWIPIAEVRRDQCFEDHFELITWAVGI